MIKKISKIILAIMAILLLTLNSLIVRAVPEPPSGGVPGENGGLGNSSGLGIPPNGTPGDVPEGASGGNSSNVSYTGETTISSDTNNSDKTYTTSEGSKNALLVDGGTVILSNITVTKSGDESSESSDFYGTNAGILAYNDATLNINGGTIQTNGSHANAVFAYGTGTINISNATIKTTKNNSGAVMVTGDGTLTANNVTATTGGNSSAPIRSDRGGGTLTVNGGTYTSNGTGSPAIYSTANITVNDATLVSTASEGTIVEGANSITLKNTTLTDTNTTLNGQSETYKNIFLYQSMSGDADEGTASFTAKDSYITTNKGDTIFVTNTTATISLTNNVIINNDTEGAFLRIQAGKWGTSGANGGTVKLNTSNQSIKGNIFVDNISTLDMKLASSSKFKGTINGDNTAENLSITLDKSSTLTLTGDSHITSLENEVSDNSNINLNGYTLYVNGEAITSTNYTEDADNVTDNEENNNNETKAINSTYAITGCIVIIILIGCVCMLYVISKSKKKEE